MSYDEPSIGIVVLTLNAEKHLVHCLKPLINSALKSRILVLDSSSSDGTIALAQKLGVETMTIPRTEFNHGKTREKARKHLNTDIIVMLTQDAYAVDDKVIEKLIKPLLDRQASVSYARQIPHDNASFFEAFPRSFNYPEASQLRSLEDLDHFGIYTFFCSNSCAAYRNQALDEIDGFKKVLFGEDTIAVAELLHKGHKIAYVAEAVVKHSHKYGLSQEFKRNFDIGLSRKQHEKLLTLARRDEKRGLIYLKTLTQHLMQKNKCLIPYAYLQTACKFVGYCLGRLSVKAPIWLKKTLSSQPFYWSNE